MKIIYQRLVPEYKKNSQDSIIRKQPDFKLVEIFEQTLHQSEMKRPSTSLLIRKMKIKITMNYHYTSIRMSKIKKADPQIW